MKLCFMFVRFRKFFHDCETLVPLLVGYLPYAMTGIMVIEILLKLILIL